LLSFTQQEFEFTGFVAPSGKSGTVVTFDKEFWPAEKLTQIFKWFKWSWQVGEM
jgi:hypothetical protein